MSAAIALLLGVAGLAALGLSTERYARPAGALSLRAHHGMRLRVAGGALLPASIAAALTRAPLTFGLVEWFGLIAVAGAVVALSLHYAPRALVRIGLGALVAGGALTLAAIV